MSSSKGSSQNTVRKTSSGADIRLPEFVACELSDEQKKFVKAHVPEWATIVDQLDRLVRDGYKFSFRYEEKSLAVAAWLTGPERGSENSGLVLSSRGPGIDTALAVLFYKHFEVLAEDWRTAGLQGAKRDNWG